MIDRYRKMMFRTARRITQNDCDADDVIQRLCVRFVIGGIPAGLRENPTAYLIGAIVNEAKNVHRTRERRRIERTSICRSFRFLPAAASTRHCWTLSRKQKLPDSRGAGSCRAVLHARPDAGGHRRDEKDGRRDGGAEALSQP